MSKESLLESIGTEGFFRSQKSVMIRDLKYPLNVFEVKKHTLKADQGQQRSKPRSSLMTPMSPSPSVFHGFFDVSLYLLKDE